MDDQHATVANMVRDFAMKAKMTQNRNSLQLFSGGFATFTTADNAYLFSNSHTTLSGDTVDNLSTDALSVSALEDAMVALMEQKDQTGEVIGHVPACLLVPPKLFREAIEITDSEQVSDSADNAVNWVSSKFNLSVKMSPYIGAAAGGSDTNWFLLARNHKLFRFVRQSLITDLVDYKYQRNDNYIYKGSYREVIAPQSWEGTYGSTGAG